MTKSFWLKKSIQAILSQNKSDVEKTDEIIEMLEESNMSTIIEYDIPIQDEEQCEEQNRMIKSLGGTHLLKPTEEHIDILFEKINNAIEEVGDNGGWYVGDGIKVKVELEYDPEDK